MFDVAGAAPGAGGEDGCAGAVGDAVGGGEAVFGQFDGAGGASDVLAVQAEAVEQAGFADAGGALSGLGSVELGQEAGDAGKVRPGFAALGKFGGVGVAEGFHAAPPVVTALVSVVHGAVPV